MQAGKLPLEMLAGLLDEVEATDPRVVLGPRPGEDAAIIDIGDRYLVAKTDPITFATDLIGWYLVQVNVNDLAVAGATPRWLLVTLLLPEGASPDMVADIFRQLREACASLDIALVGGHTEITYDLPRPVAVGALLGEADKDEIVLTSGVRPGDSILLTKGVAIEGTSILAREAPEALAAGGVDADVIERAREMLFSPGISVLRDTEIVRSAATVHAMHDPTEGGVATGLLEMATAAGVGLAIDGDRIPVVPECAQVCGALGLDPLGLIASGALLAAVAPEDAPRVVAALAEQSIHAAEIGRATDASEGLKLAVAGEVRELPRFDRDELARYLAP